MPPLSSPTAGERCLIQSNVTETVRPQDLDELVRMIAPLMRGFAAPWAVAGGWAIDLSLDRVTRPHGDVELAVFRADQHLLHDHFRGWTFEKIVDGRRLPWQRGEEVSLPVHEIHARSPDDPRRSIELLLNERAADHWVFRRDPRVTLPLERAILTSPRGLPILSPAIVLLYKSKDPRAKDEADFRVARPALDREMTNWLRLAIATSQPDRAPT